MILGPVICPKCKAEMIEGFLYTRGFATTFTKWIQGRPKIGIFSGVIKTAESDVRRVETYRCPSCGFLESYAKEPGR